MELLEHWRQQLIPEWRIHATDEVDPGDRRNEPLGRAGLMDDHQQGFVFISAAEAHDDPAELENTVIHEILHLLLSPLTEQTCRIIETLSADRQDTERDLMRGHEEQIVDRISWALTGHTMFGTVQA